MAKAKLKIVPEPNPFKLLAERVERAVAPDRLIDVEVCALLEVCEPPDCNPTIHASIIEKVRAGGDDCEIERYTASLDACVNLINARLPHLHWDFGREPHKELVTFRAQLVRPSERYKANARAWHSSMIGAATPSLALLAAILRACEDGEHNA